MLNTEKLWERINAQETFRGGARTNGWLLFILELCGLVWYGVV